MVWTSSTELPESIAVEMSIDETVETFTAAKQNALKAKSPPSSRSELVPSLSKLA